jgi:hypothetical protein
MPFYQILLPQRDATNVTLLARLVLMPPDSAQSVMMDLEKEVEVHGHQMQVANVIQISLLGNMMTPMEIDRIVNLAVIYALEQQLRARHALLISMREHSLQVIQQQNY